ncbi:ICP0-binding domain of ubiquitin-specific protease 7-domain-containing protein [Pisolithus marmoratus]|nr:ICP0-binding domain of ubiquitin-specific protease 7-domain-containing protein [Pisolithus marmoratus]
MDTVSVHDHEAFAARHLPDLSHGVKDFQVYTWRLTNWKKLEQRITSPEFDCGGHKWRILLFPFGNSNSSSNDTVSVYLDYAEPNKSPPGWHACAQFALVISNVHDPTIYTVSHAQHRFIADECDWGFTRFSELRKLFNIQKGHLRPTIEETSADVTVFVRVVEDPTGVLWHEEPPQHEAKRREREEQHLFLTARVITDDTFARHEGFDLVTFDEKNSPQSVLPTFRILKQETYSTFKSRVAAHFGIPDNKVRLWVLVSRQNKTVRPHMHIPEDKASLTVEMIRNNMAARRNDLRLYLDVITYPSKPDPPPGYSIVFLKHFDTSKQTLHGVGKVYVSRNSKVEDLHPIIHERMRWTPGTPLRLYEEIRPGMIRSMKPKLTFSQSEIQNGDVICFQVKQEKKELRYLDNQGLYSNPSDFYDFLQNRVTIIFRPKFEEPDNDHPEFSLVLSKKHNYDTMSQRAAKHLRHDHSKLRFTTTDAANGHPKAILRQSANQSIADIVGSSCVNTTTTVILYEKRDTHDQGSARLSTVSPRPVCTKLPRGTHTGPEHPASPCTSVDSCSSSLRATAGEEVPLTLVADSPPSPPSEANKPPQPSRTTLSGAGTSRVVDEVVEAIRQDKDLDPHQERLLGCIVDPSSISTTLVTSSLSRCIPNWHSSGACRGRMPSLWAAGDG